MFDRIRNWTPSPAAMQRLSRHHVRVYRLTGGRVGGRADGLAMLLLTTHGRKTGLWRTAPLPYYVDGDDLLVAGTNAGLDRDPAWVHNIRADAAVRYQVGTRRGETRAHIASGDERRRLWEIAISVNRRYPEYQRATEREIPVVVLPGAGVRR